MKVQTEYRDLADEFLLGLEPDGTQVVCFQMVNRHGRKSQVAFTADAIMKMALCLASAKEHLQTQPPPGRSH